jgi:hypothetical protein
MGIFFSFHGDRTREIWKPRLGRDLSREDARQIVENMTGFFAILTEWSRAEMPVPANDTTKPSTSDAGGVPQAGCRRSHRRASARRSNPAQPSPGPR